VQQPAPFEDLLGRPAADREPAEPAFADPVPDRAGNAGIEPFGEPLAVGYEALVAEPVPAPVVERLDDGFAPPLVEPLDAGYDPVLDPVDPLDRGYPDGVGADPRPSALPDRVDVVPDVDPEAEPDPGSDPDPEPAERRTAPSARELVRALNERGDELFGVADTCQVLAEEVVERAVADAAAVLVPDGAVWRVGGGVGLRPMERRALLDATHWIITEIALGGQALLLTDAESVRPRLAGAPLAGWDQLIAVPVPEVNAVVAVARARGGRPFTRADLDAVAVPVNEAARLLSAAMATRRLARLLAPLAEDDA
jgi:hypothetical protein